ncbi:MAG: zinc ribbon domain-containing protein [Oscillospiraceae bacterium]|nr:zinc ribbon domain-containing protein [Oscillospiraceae bacterium]
MFCSNCGNQIPDDTKFCNNCGAQQQIVENTEAASKTTVNQPKIADTPTQQPKKEPKKKANTFVVLAVVLCAFVIGKFVIAPSMVSDSGNNGDKGNQGSQSQQTTNNNNSSTVNAANPSYAAVFDDTYIVHFQDFFNVAFDIEMKNFALKQNDGTICCADYGYKDDVVKQWVETMYIPVSGYTDTQKTELENTMKTQFATVDALKCCTVAYKMSANYFTITCTYSGVDQASNYAELYNAGILQTNTFISMSATETTLLNQGFVKK